MEINRTFWSREKGSIKQSFSYAKDSTAANFAKKYGGSLLTSISVDDAVSEMVASGEVYSVLVNNEPELEMDNSTNEYIVYAKQPGKPWTEWAGFSTISEANTEAKNIIKNNESVLVVKYNPE